MNTLHKISAIAAPLVALGAMTLGTVTAQAAPPSEALTVQLDEVREHSVGDDTVNVLVADVEVCLDDLPRGDRDGVVYVTHDNFTLSQNGYEGREAKPWEHIDSGVITSAEDRVLEVIDNDNAFPREVALAEGECASGKLPFVVAQDRHVTPQTTALIFENDYHQREEFLIR